MTGFDSHKFYSLKHNHQDIDMLLDKIAKGWVLSEKDYKKLIVDIGLNNISTFTGDYEALFNKPNLVQMINEALAKINIPEESTIDEKISIVRNEILQQVSDAKLTAFYNSQQGKEATVLWEDSKKGDQMHGFTENYVKVETKYDKNKVNTFEKITIKTE